MVDAESEWAAHPGSNGHSGSATRSGPSGRGRRRAPARESPAAGAGPDDGPDADPEALARTIVLRKLAATARTRHELATALAEREVPAEAASAVLDRMESVGLVDDRAFAHDWVESRQRRRHLSGTALRRELQRKGVDRELIEDAVAGLGPDDELAAAVELAQKKARSTVGLPRDVRYRRLAGALGRRGFGGSTVAAAIGRALDDAPG